jgi:cyclohexa-1,5-dienecarbonyl-CoA hydratase
MIHEACTDGIAQLTLDAPPLNILTRELLAALRARLDMLAGDPALRVLVVAARGRHFSAGASVDEHLPPVYADMIREFTDTVLGLYHFPAPVIAAVQGRCLGGGFELVQAADIVVAADDAVFGQPEIKLGVFPPVACALLPQTAAAAELIFTGEPLDARAAAAAGLVRHVVAREELDARTRELATAIARHSAAAVRAAKRARRAAAEPIDLRAAAAVRVYIDDLMSTHDAVEGLTAFIDRRPPAWRHS